MSDIILKNLKVGQIHLENKEIAQAFELSAVQILNTACFSPTVIRQFNELSSNYLKSRQLATFAFARVFDDERAFMLYSDPTIAKYVVENQVHITAHVPTILLKDQFWYLPAKDGHYAKLMHDIKQITNASSWADLIVRQPGF